jgi:hypothetical protein
MDFIHLLFEMVVVEVALLRGLGAVFGVEQLGVGELVPDGDKDLAADDLIEALGDGWEFFQVVIIEGPDGGVI